MEHNLKSTCLLLMFLSLFWMSDPVRGFDPLRNYKEVELQELREQPETFKGTEVEFTIYFHRIDEVWSPFFSPFSPGDYMAFSGWGEAQAIWKKNEMVRDFPFMYVQNGDDAVEELLAAEKYDVLRIQGTVKSAFKSYPWIEVQHVDITQKKAFTREQLRHLMLGQEADRNGHPTEATKHLENGLKMGRLTRSARTALHRQLAINYYRSMDFKKALRQIRSFRKVSDEKGDQMLKKIKRRSEKLLKMSPQERKAYQKKIQENSAEGSKVGLKTNRDPNREQSTEERGKKHRLPRELNRSRKQVRALQQKNRKLQKKLDRALQEKSELLARLRESTPSAERANRTHSPDDTDRTELPDHRGTGSQADGASRDYTQEKDQRVEKLLSRIRVLKRRNRSLRSKMSSRSGKRTTRGELDREKNQAELKTGTVFDLKMDRMDTSSSIDSDMLSNPGQGES